MSAAGNNLLINSACIRDVGRGLHIRVFISISNFEISRIESLRVCAYRKCIVQKCLSVYVCIVDGKYKNKSWSCISNQYSESTCLLLNTVIPSIFSRKYVHFGGFKYSLMYSFCPALLNNSRGTINCNFVIITLQSSAACQVKLSSDSMTGLVSSFQFDNYTSTSRSKFNDISVITIADKPSSAFLAAKPMTRGVKIIKLISCCALSPCWTVLEQISDIHNMICVAQS